MSTASAEVLIVGAGPTGLTLATALANRGIQTAVINAGCAVSGKCFRKSVRKLRKAWNSLIHLTRQRRRLPLPVSRSLRES